MTSQQLHWSVVMLVLDQHYYDDAGHQHADIRYTVVVVVLFFNGQVSGVKTLMIDVNTFYHI